MDRRVLVGALVAACGREPAPASTPANRVAPVAPDAGAASIDADAGSLARVFAKDIDDVFEKGGLGIDPARGLGEWNDSYDTSPPKVPDEDYVLVGACEATRGIDAAEARNDFEYRDVRANVGDCYERNGLGQNIDIEVTLIVTPDLSIPVDVIAELATDGAPGELAACVERDLEAYFADYGGPSYARSWLRSDASDGKRRATETCVLHLATPP